jgi:hypothetical protein
LKVHFGEESLGRILLRPDEALGRLPYFELGVDDLRRVRNGLSIKVSQAPWNDAERVKMRDEKGNLIAVAEFSAAEGSLHPRVVIATENS